MFAMSASDHHDDHGDHGDGHGAPSPGHDDHGAGKGVSPWMVLVVLLILGPVLYCIANGVFGVSAVGFDPVSGEHTSPLLLAIILAPALGALINGTVGHKLPRAVVNVLGSAAIGMAFLFAIVAVGDLIGLEAPAAAGHHAHAPITFTMYKWIWVDTFTIPVRFVLDPLSAVMILVITGVGFLIHVYSTGYMSQEPSYARYFAYLNLFCFAMLVLVLGGNMLMTFIGWEGVGLCSYLLIGFWFTDDAKASAGKKAFVVNRVGDFAFIIGMFLIFSAAGSLDYTTITTLASNPETSGPLAAIATAATIFLFIGCTGKSAQIPLYVWLPDAMAGPTPVSALIHAATMVTAGIYLIARMNALFIMSSTTMWIVVVVGGATALMAATIAITQNDIKKVLAYSTVSQLGYMFMAVGSGAYTAGVFHLMTHAFFKALLFLGAGAVIHGMHHEQDIRKMGGLRKHMPIVHWTFLIGCLAIAGVPGLAGFFSKDEILWNVFAQVHAGSPMESMHMVVWIVGVVTAGLTAFYMFRLYFVTFTGKSRVDAHVTPHRAPMSMAIPLMILALLSAFGGYLGVPHVLAFLVSWIPGIGESLGHNVMHGWLEQVFLPSANSLSIRFDHAAEGMWEWATMGVSVVVALSGIGLAYYLYVVRGSVPASDEEPQGFAYKVLSNKYYVDELYELTIIKPIILLGRFLHKVVDEVLIDLLLVNGTAWLVESLGAVGKRVQDGNVQRYAGYIVIGLGIIVFLLLMR